MDKIIVSLTSYPARINAIDQVLMSLVNQTRKPDKIVLYLSEQQFPDKCLPLDLSAFGGNGVEIHWCKEDLKSHKKYFYAFQEYPDDCVITVDDDFYYDRHMVEELVKYAERFPRCVLARRTHLITAKEDQIAPYQEWWGECKKYIGIPRMDLFSTGCGGVLYPPHVLPQEVFNAKIIEESCLYADDMWLKVMELLNDIPVVQVETNNWDVPHERFVHEGLYQVYNGGDGNDRQLNNLLRKYDNCQAPVQSLTQRIFRDGKISACQVEQLKMECEQFLLQNWVKKLEEFSGIVIYGAGKMAKRIYTILMRYDLCDRIKAFVVSDCDNNPSDLYGIDVIKYTDVFWSDVVYVVGNLDMREQIKISDMLLLSGVPDKRIEVMSRGMKWILCEEVPL